MTADLDSDLDPDRSSAAPRSITARVARALTALALIAAVAAAAFQLGRGAWAPPDWAPSIVADYLKPSDAAAASQGGADATSPSSETAAQAGERKIKYYRNPMGLPDTSPTPKKDSMGMDYIAVYEGEDEDGSTIRISPGKLQRTGVRSEKAERRALVQPVRAPGTVAEDERRVAVVALRAPGFIEMVENVTTGDHVRKGQPLMRIYSPEISAAAAQYLSVISERSAASPIVVDGAKRRLENLDVSGDFLAEIERTRRVPPAVIWRAPRDGVVLERRAVEGMRAEAGDVLFRVVDHAMVWVLADVAERDLGLVAEGQSASVRLRAFPDRVFSGKVALIYPHLMPETRTARLRIELPNPDGLLRPDMYAEVEIATGADKPVVAVPKSAVIDSGARQSVILDKGEGRFEPREVTLGRRGESYVEIADGISEGDEVVVSANFLIDAESNLKAALRGLTEGEAAAPGTEQPQAPAGEPQ